MLRTWPLLLVVAVLPAGYIDASVAGGWRTEASDDVVCSAGLQASGRGDVDSPPYLHKSNNRQVRAQLAAGSQDEKRHEDVTKTHTTKAETKSAESGFADIGGAKLYYEVLGEGTPLILIHGGLIDRRMWDGQFEGFARQFRVVRYDVHGHGLSRNSRGDYNDHEDLHALMAHLDIGKAFIAGLSMGGQIAVGFALQYPDMVEGLVLVAPGLSGYQFTASQLGDNQAQFEAAYGAGDLDQAVEFFLQAWTDGPQRIPADVDPVVRERVRVMLAEGVTRFVNQAGRQVLDPPAIGRLEQIHVPTLCVVGNLDMPVILTIVDMLANKIPGARKVVIPGVAHMVNMERPNEFNRVVLDFLSKR